MSLKHLLLLLFLSTCALAIRVTQVNKETIHGEDLTQQLIDQQNIQYNTKLQAVPSVITQSMLYTTKKDPMKEYSTEGLSKWL